MKFNLTIPFPAFEAINVFNTVAPEVRSNPYFSNLWDGVPRRIEMRNTPLPEGADQAYRITLWYEGGTYAHFVMKGEGTGYGTQWSPLSLRLRWKAFRVALVTFDEPQRFSIEFHEKEIVVLQGAARARRFGQSAGPEVETLLAEKAEPVRAAVERQRIADATWEAEQEGRSGCWLQDRRHFSPVVLPPVYGLSGEKMAVPPTPEFGGYEMETKPIK